MSNDSDNVGRKTGRPPKREGPKVPYDEIDKLLVFGEVVTVGEGEGEGPTTVYPSYRVLARRYGCAHSLISYYSIKHDCMRRREVARARVVAKVNEKLVELRANAIAMVKDDQIRVIDNFLHGFEEALAEGKVRFDDPGYFDKFCRLRAFLEGGADSRSEIHACLSLEQIQARHRQMMKAMESSSAAERGEVDQHHRDLPEATSVLGRQLDSPSPAPFSAKGSQDVGIQPEAEEPSGSPHAPHGRLSRALLGAPEHEPKGRGSAPHGPDVAPVGPDAGGREGAAQ